MIHLLIALIIAAILIYGFIILLKPKCPVCGSRKHWVEVSDWISNQTTKDEAYCSNCRKALLNRKNRKITTYDTKQKW